MIKRKNWLLDTQEIPIEEANEQEAETIRLITRYNIETHNGYYLAWNFKREHYTMINQIEAKIPWMSGELSTINAHLRDHFRRF